MNIKSPYTILTIVIVIIAILIIGSSQWFKNLFASKAAEGSACTTGTGKAGTVTNGTCMENPGPAPLPLLERTIVPTYTYLPTIIALRRLGGTFASIVTYLGGTYQFIYAIGYTGYYRRIA